MIIIDGKEVRINRANAFVSEMDTAYCDLVRKILTTGIRAINRTGIDSIAIPGWFYQFDMSKGFPIAETKKVVASNFTNEIQWIHQVQSNKVKWLQDRGNPTWNSWVVDPDGIYRVYEQGENAINDPERPVPLMRQVFDSNTGNTIKVEVLDGANKPIYVQSPDILAKKDNPRTLKEAILFGEDLAGTIGEQYGFINATYKQPQCVENTLKNDPYDRRMVIDLWQKAHFARAVLPSCVFCSEYTVTGDGKLHAFVHQRSADVPLGLPFNISQYAVLLCMFAKANGFEPGTLSWSIMNAHIYVNQIEPIKKQLKRYDYMKEYEKLIQSSTDETIEREYNRISEKFNLYDQKAFTYLWRNSFLNNKELTKEAYKKMAMTKKQELLKEMVEKGLIQEVNFVAEFDELFEKKQCFEHMLTRETPELELAEHNSIFDYSTEYVPKGDPYLNENPIGNKEIVLKKYHPTSFIKFDIAV